MSVLGGMRKRLRSWMPRAAADVDEEFRSTLEAYAQDLMGRGMPAEEARRKARIDLGRPDAQHERYRDALGLRLFDELSGDFRYGVRAIRRNPGFAAVAVVSLALGIGATTAMFSLIYAVLLHPFPYAGADRIMNPVIVNEQHPDQPQWFPLTEAQFQVMRQAGPINSLLGFNNSHMEMTGSGLPEAVFGVYLTENAGSFFGVRPLLGRNLEPSDGENGGHAVVVLNYRFWQRRFSGDPQVVGQTLELDHAAYTVIGVMPRSFAFNNTTGVGDVYLPSSRMRAVARVPYMAYIPWIKLKRDVTLAQADAALEPLVRQFAKEHPERYPDHWHLALQPLVVPYEQQTGKALMLLLAGVVLLLIIGCVNCSVLLLARGSTRQQELAVRLAIGASRWRIVRQLLVESVVISCAGALVGVGASHWLAKVPLLLSPDSFPPESEIRVNAPMLVFSVALAIACGVVSGLAPALRLAWRGSEGALSPRRAGVTAWHSTRRWSVLIAAQVALTLVLMGTAGTAIRSFLQLTREPLGYDPEDVMSLGIMLHVHDPGEWGRRIQLHDVRAAYIEKIRASIASVPGVTEAAVSTDATPPYAGAASTFELDGEPAREQPQARVLLTGPQYFAALRIPLIEGRMWSADENARGDFVAVVNRAFAARYLAQGSTLGRRVRVPGLTTQNRFASASAQSAGWRTILGVVGDARNDGLDRPAVPALYVPYTALMQPYEQFLVRTQGDPRTYLHSIRAAIASVAADQEVSRGAAPLREDIERDAQYSRQRLFSILFGAYSAMALGLALVGIFSVVAYSVAQRTVEFGLRMALGAPRRHVLWIAGRIALASAVAGIALGLGCDGFLGAVLAHWMQNAFAADTLLAAAGLLAICALTACLLPARHAIAVQPAEALRNE
ncbi:ABC transporter permease [Acidobacteria bacterium AB60]|nr:ABC transporter permease [Acidobacteria bacterium AB60]